MSNLEIDLKVGQILEDKIEIISLIATGASGAVYKGYHKILDQTVAIKILQLQKAETDDWRQRFISEAQLLSTFDHENIVAFRSFGFLPDQRPYMVLEFLQGKNVAEELAEHGAFATDRALAILIQISSALAYAHSKGVIHRDIKPANILLCQTDATETAKVLDFGIFKTIHAENQSLTQTGIMLGSVNYMSPEQCQLQTLDWRSDIYSFACLAYEMLVGQPPMQAQSDMLIMSNHVNKVIDSVPAKNGISKKLSALILRCLAKKPSGRIASTEELRMALIACRGENSLQERHFELKKLLMQVSVLACSILLAVQFLSNKTLTKKNDSTSESKSSFRAGHWAAGRDIVTPEDKAEALHWLNEKCNSKSVRLLDLSRTAIKYIQLNADDNKFLFSSTVDRIIEKLKLAPKTSLKDYYSRQADLASIFVCRKQDQEAIEIMLEMSKDDGGSEKRQKFRDTCSGIIEIILRNKRLDNARRLTKLMLNSEIAAADESTKAAAYIMKAKEEFETADMKGARKSMERSEDLFIQYIRQDKTLPDPHIERFCQTAQLVKLDSQQVLRLLQALYGEQLPVRTNLNHSEFNIHLYRARAYVFTGRNKQAIKIARFLRDCQVTDARTVDQLDVCELIILTAMRQDGQSDTLLKAELKSFLEQVRQISPESVDNEASRLKEAGFHL